jgi:hypothetical protein
MLHPARTLTRAFVLDLLLCCCCVCCCSLEATNALVEAYKQHLSDEVASHHQREENWLHIQEDWERLEKEMEAEINS